MLLFLLFFHTSVATTVCRTFGAVTDKFDDVQISPVVPDLNPIIGPVPTGTYLKYDGMGYANVGSLSNNPPPSPPNDIFVEPLTNNAVIQPKPGSIANSFSLRDFAYTCVVSTGVTFLEVSPSCKFQITCVTSRKRQVQQEFQFVPRSPASGGFNQAKLNATFSQPLTSCVLKLIDSGLASLPPSNVTNAVTILAIDNVVNNGYRC